TCAAWTSSACDSPSSSAHRCGGCRPPRTSRRSPRSSAATTRGTFQGNAFRSQRESRLDGNQHLVIEYSGNACMKAVLCKAYGPPESLVVEDVPSPEPGPGEVVVSVKAASVNFPDVLIIQNKYQFKPQLPFSPGSEVAGDVKTIGDGVTTVNPRDR